MLQRRVSESAEHYHKNSKHNMVLVLSEYGTLRFLPQTQRRGRKLHENIFSRFHMNDNTAWPSSPSA